jgi:hypothetical protein
MAGTEKLVCWFVGFHLGFSGLVGCIGVYLVTIVWTLVCVYVE